MKQLIQSENKAEIDGIRILLESRGIPVFVGNEDSARNMGWLLSAREYVLWVLVDEQYEDAVALVEDPSHEVRTAVNMEKYSKSFGKMHEQNMQKIFNWLMFFLVVMIGVFIAIAAANGTP